jgi:ABC-2 type transport system ATP-binding protein
MKDCAMFLELDDVKLSLGGRPILKGVTLSIGEGEIYGLLGPNGAGKSTTIAAALGLLPISSGRVRLLGLKPSGPGKEALRARIGAMPEQNGLYEWMSGQSYLHFFAALYQVSPGREVKRSLERVGLQDVADSAIATYSRGMRQRLALARALINRPRLLVLDEPTNGLDPRGRRELHDIFLGLAAEGTSILLCTHLLDDVERLCSRVGLIVDGRTVAEGQISELVAHHGEQNRFRLSLEGSVSPPKSLTSFDILGREGDAVLVQVASDTNPAEAWREAFEAGWPIVEINHVEGGLEALYLNLTSAGQAQERRVA